MQQASSLLRKLDESAEKPEYAVELEGVSYSYDTKNYVLRDFNLKVKQGAFLALIGPSGSGKTTLFRIITGLVKPNSGSVKVLGAAKDEIEKVRRRIGYIPQQLGLVRSLTAIENVLIGAHDRISLPCAMLGAFPKSEVEFARECLSLVGMEHKAKEKVHALSGGERQRVAIARALAQKPAIILADEFVSNLDVVRAREIMHLVKDVKSRNTTVIFSTHDIALARDYTETAVVVKDGRKLAEVCSSKLSYDVVEDMFA